MKDEILYNSIDAESARYGERNDCVVKALTAISELPYGTVHEVCRLAGRKRGRGMHMYKWLPLIDTVGCKVTGKKYEPKKPDGSGYTMKTILKGLHPNKKYLVHVRGHVAAVVNGKIVDWSAGRQHRVKTVYEIDGDGEVMYTKPAQPKAFTPKSWTHRKGACVDIWAYCDAHRDEDPKMIRFALIEKGFNRNTVNRQVNEWRKARGLA